MSERKGHSGICTRGGGKLRGRGGTEQREGPPKVISPGDDEEYSGSGLFLLGEGHLRF